MLYEKMEDLIEKIKSMEEELKKKDKALGHLKEKVKEFHALWKEADEYYDVQADMISCYKRNLEESRAQKHVIDIAIKVKNEQIYKLIFQNQEKETEIKGQKTEIEEWKRKYAKITLKFAEYQNKFETNLRD